MPKYLFTFAKTESVRWLGHLDILRTFERAIRRAGLPIAFSNGFNPRERISFASALSTGVTGAAEPALLELTTPVDAEQLVQQLNEALPPGIRVNACEEVADAGSRDLLNAFAAAEYAVVCGCPENAPPEAVTEAICGLMAQPSIEITRSREGRTKTLNIRPYIFHLALCPESLAGERLTLNMTVALGETGNARPGEVVTALSERLPGLTLRRAHRIQLIQTIPS